MTISKNYGTALKHLYTFLYPMKHKTTFKSIRPANPMARVDQGGDSFEEEIAQKMNAAR